MQLVMMMKHFVHLISVFLMTNPVLILPQLKLLLEEILWNMNTLLLLVLSLLMMKLYLLLHLTLLHFLILLTEQWSILILLPPQVQNPVGISVFQQKLHPEQIMHIKLFQILDVVTMVHRLILITLILS